MGRPPAGTSMESNLLQALPTRKISYSSTCSTRPKRWSRCSQPEHRGSAEQINRIGASSSRRERDGRYGCAGSQNCRSRRSPCFPPRILADRMPCCCGDGLGHRSSLDLSLDRRSPPLSRAGASAVYPEGSLENGLRISLPALVPIQLVGRLTVEKRFSCSPVDMSPSIVSWNSKCSAICRLASKVFEGPDDEAPSFFSI